MTNRQLSKALLEKLGISQSALSQRVKKLKMQRAMTTEDATYLIAHQEGIPLDKYLINESIDRVRNLQNTLAPTRVQSSARQTTKKRTTGSGVGHRTIVIGGEFKLTDPILEQKKLSEAKEMAAIYPFLYVLENSIREVIDRFMTNRYGTNWWDAKGGKLKDKVIQRMADEEKNSWHQRRGARPIDYLDLMQLPTLVRQIQDDLVPDIIPTMEWFTQFIDEVYKSRCVVCHMNPLDDTNIKAVKVRFSHWQRQIEAKKGLIPKP